MNLESPFLSPCCLNSTLSMNRNYTLGWWWSWIPLRFTPNLAVDLSQDSLIWKNRRYPFKLGSSVRSRWVHISSNRQAGDFHLACETWKQAGASLFACVFFLSAAQSPCVLSCPVAKTITCADTGNLRLACYALRGGVLPEKRYHFTTQAPIMTLWFSHLQGIPRSDC